MFFKKSYILFDTPYFFHKFYILISKTMQYSVIFIIIKLMPLVNK